MNQNFFTKLIFSTAVVLSICSLSSNANFSENQTFTQDTFKDVSENNWYYNDVKTAYTLGLVNGKGNSLFSPNDKITVAEGITLASRIHAICYDKVINGEQSSKNWYDSYVNYSIVNGLIEAGEFENYDRDLLRHEMATLISKAMPDEYFTKINDVSSIPDVAPEDEYFDDLIKLYNAGIVMGSTAYGDFMPVSPITRCETAAVISRAVTPSGRIKKTLLDYGRRGEAVYLINDYSMMRTVRNVSRIASGWKYENTADMTIDDKNTSSNVLVDKSNQSSTAIHRDITTVSDGIVELEISYTPVTPGYKLILSDINGENMFSFESKSDGSHIAVGNNEQPVDYSFKKQIVNAYFILDLDSRQAKIVIDGKDIGTFDMSENATDISRLSVVTGKAEQTNLTVNTVFMYTNFIINDLFRTTPIGNAPYSWKTTGDVTVQTQISDSDTNSVRINGNGSASKNFDNVSGEFVYETFVKVPSGKNIDISLKNSEKTVITVNAKDGKFTTGGQLLRKFNSNIWQLLRIEADTSTKTALIKINNKACLEIPFNTDFIDSIEITSSGNGYAWFDNVELYNVYDYADYCPEPVPVTDDGIYLGMSVCSLWQEGTHYGWDYISPYDELTPLMGYYDEGIPEVADWEIKMLVEHGYDFQHFCWYAGSSTDGIKEPRLCAALHDGYMNAKYSHMQDFMLMWENAGYGSGGFDKFKSEVWDYWCEWYFSDSRYFTIDNKPVLTIYQYSQFINAMGGQDQAKNAIAFMKEDIKKLGFDGMIILFCSRGTSSTDNALFKNLGADAMMSYNFGEMSYDPQHQINSMNSAFNAGNLSLVPCIGVGFNDIGWTETRTPNATPEAHKEVMVWARDNYMPRIDEREDEDWISKLVIANTWNEYGEGHYIMPSNLNGFGYLDAARDVFSSVAYTDDCKHYDVAPTENQKKRFSYLYPNRTQPIKRTYWIANDVNYDKLPIIKGWNFENVADTGAWLPLMQLSTLYYDKDEQALVGTATGNDPAIHNIKASTNYLDADSIKYMKIRMKYENNATSSASIFFNTEGDTNYSGDRGVHFNVISTDNEYKDYYIDLSANKYWQGTVTQVRIDPMAMPGKFYIKSIEFLGEQEIDIFNLNVDGKTMKLTSDFVNITEDEIFLAGDPTYGFYSLNNFYTEWNRHTGKLFVKTGTEHTFEFTVGSDTAIVDGVSMKLPDTFYIVDGLPALPMKFVYNNAEITYEETSDGFNVKIRNGDIFDIINSRVTNEFEFNVDNDNEGWTVGSATGYTSDGCIIITSTPTSSGKYDPIIQNKNVVIDASLYNRAVIRIKPVYADNNSSDVSVTIYFSTSSDTTLNEKKTLRLHLKNFAPDDEGFYTLTFDATQNELWTGSVMTVRVDPPNRAGDYYIDYIRFLKDPDAENKINEEKLKAELREQNLAIADNGGPFYIENANAEDSSFKPLNQTYYFSDDALISGNHVFEHIPNGSKKNWAYITIPTRFKPGVTYKVEMDVRVTKDHLGNDVTDASLAWNLRYSDIVDGLYKPTVDHPKGIGKFSTSDGWKHITFTHTISENSITRENDTFAIYANPQDLSDGSYRVIGYMIDNIKVSVVE